MINTKKVRDRRKLRFESLGEAVDDAAALVEAVGRGTLRSTGNWTLGQALGHLAFWASAPFDGYPPMPSPPLLMRLMMPLMRGYILNKGMPAGVRLPNNPDGTFGVELMDPQQGLAAMRKAFERMAAQVPPDNNPMFRNMSHDDWKKLNERHAELHLSFFHPT